MKISELMAKLKEKQRRTVQSCLKQCGIMDLEEEVDHEVNKEIIRFLKLISNPIRIGILKMLRDKWMCVCLISQALEQDQTLISHHLRSLREMNLVFERREGKLKFYKTNLEEFKRYLKFINEEFKIDV